MDRIRSGNAVRRSLGVSLCRQDRRRAFGGKRQRRLVDDPSGIQGGVDFVGTVGYPFPYRGTQCERRGVAQSGGTLIVVGPLPVGRVPIEHRWGSLTVRGGIDMSRRSVRMLDLVVQWAPMVRDEREVDNGGSP